MRIFHKGVPYDTIYSPFFRITKSKDFAVYGIRYPSGQIEDLVVFDQQNYIAELKEHLLFLLKEYGLEDDEMLTERAKDLKKDVKILFGLD